METLHDFSLFLDPEGDNDTGVAAVNAGSEAAQITMRLYGPEAELIATAGFQLEPGRHLARFINELFDKAI